MQVVDFGPFDMYAARCTGWGWRRVGALEVNRMIRKSGIGCTSAKSKKATSRKISP
jgi:hypothetical protein